MWKKFIIVLVIIFTLPVILYILFPSDYKRIKKLVREGSEAIEREDIDNVMSKVSYSYRDDYGFTYLYLKEFLKKTLERYSDIKIEYENLDITISDNRASARMDLRVIVSLNENRGYIIGDIKNPAKVVLELEKERFGWKVVRTELQDYY